MGIFQKIKRIFVKPVEIDKNKKDDLIVHSSASGKIKIGKELAVPQGYVCLLVSKEKVLDRFTAGTYKLAVENIPAVCRTLKLTVPNKRGKYKSKFFADIYFVKLSDVENQNFSSNQGVFVKKDKNFLNATVFVKGNYSFVLSDPVLFLQSLLKVYGVVKGPIAQRQLDIWIGDLVDKKIEKNKPSLDLLNERNSTCFEGVVEYINKNMLDIGVKVSRVEVTQTILPKKIYKRTKLSYQEEYARVEPDKQLNNSGEPNFDVTENKPQEPQNPPQKANINFEQDIQTIDAGEFNQQLEIKHLNTEISSNSTFMQPNLTQPNASLQTQQNASDVESFETDIESDEIAPPTETLEEMQSKIAYKKCKYCGAINSKQAKVCFECKNPFVKTCQKCGSVIDNGDFVCPKCKSIVI